MEMTISVKDMDTLHTYLQGVMDRAKHHAGPVMGVVATVCGCIVWRADPGSLEVKQYSGEMKNVLWVAINGKFYCFTYNHRLLSVEIRQNTMTGKVLHTLNDTNTTHTAIVDLFRTL
jgi:hypothetical protein